MYIVIPVVNCDAEAYTPGIYKKLKPSKAPPTITITAPRHPIISAGFHFFRGNWSVQPYVQIEAVLRWGQRHGETQTMGVICATAPNTFRGNGYSQFCRQAIPQLLTLWRDFSSLTVAGARAGAAAGPVVWQVS